ncbi:MAG: hypothetical protein EPO08_16030 [Rhodospirillaceae bacterium]|nr:MAG: hypothetical protein EPO08_16030 [Rhodospirillaceae bacterium]
MKYLAKIRFIAELPRVTARALAVIVGSLILFGILYPLLGGAQDSAQANNQRLVGEIAQTEKNLSQVKTDHQFVLDNKDLYDSLLQGDRLIPHTRRAAIRQLQALALQRGLSTLGYSFAAAGDQSLKSVTSQPTSGQYRVSVENIELKVGAPLDTQIFEFVLDLAESFPGAAVVQYVEMQRAATIAEAMLDHVSQGQDSGIVSGDIKVTWRTAQANEPDKKSK